MNTTTLRLCLLGVLAAGCKTNPPPSYVATGVTGDETITYPDAGIQDAGIDGGPVMCAGDTDGNDAQSGFVISQIGFGSPGFVELYNHQSLAESTSGITLQGSMTVEVPSTDLGADYRLEISTDVATSGEMALYSGSTMLQYVCWGSTAVTTLGTMASQLGLWTTPGACVVLPPTGDSIHLTGAGRSYGDWTAGAPTQLGCSD